MTNAAGRRAPLAGKRVLDFGQIYSVPYMGALLADLGAEVIRIEAPHRIDVRQLGGTIDTETVDKPWNRGPTFQVLNRGKRSIVLDMSKERGREIFKRLVPLADIVVENFTPRVMRNWGLHHEELAKLNPRIILLSNCGYGGTGPWSPLPIQGTALEATMGIVAYTGFEDGQPSKVGQSYPDFLASWTGVFAVLVALRHVAATGQGQWIDQGMYQIGAHTVPEPQLQYQLDGTDLGRHGNRHPWKSPSNLYRAAGEDKWFAISVDSDEQWRSLLSVMGRQDVAADPRFATVTARRAHNAEVDEVVGAWAATQDKFEVVKRLQAAGIPSGTMFDSFDLTYDEHLLQRGFYEGVDYGPNGVRPVIGRPFRMRNTPLHIQHKAPEYAEANRYVLGEILGMSEEEIAALYTDEVLYDNPVNPPPPPRPGAPGMAALASRQDGEYRERQAAIWGKEAAEATDQVAAK